MKNRMTRLLMLALCLAMFATISPNTACAFDRVELDHPNSLALVANYEGVGIPGVTFKVNCVALMDEDARFDLIEPFTAFDGDINAMDHAADWVEAVEFMYPLAEAMGPEMVGATDGDGFLVFEDLMPGLYLVSGESVTIAPWMYTFAPFLISVPGRDMEDEWIYDVIADVKMDREPHLVELEVVKVWDDNQYERLRPARIRVQLLQDGVPIQQVYLRRSQNWHYVFHDLPNGHAYTVEEVLVPLGYEVSYRVENGVLVIVNTYDGETTPPPDLPQTGQLNWPIPILAGLGLILFTTGWIIHRKWSQEHEEP